MKTVLFTLLALVILTLAVQAQDLRMTSGGTARNISLGGGPLNPFLDDVMRVHTNPALLGKFGDYFWGDLGYVTQDASSYGHSNFGNGQYQYFGASFNLCDQWVLGVMVNKREGPMFNTSEDATIDPIDAINSNEFFSVGRPMSPVEVAASYAASNVFNVGLSVALAGWSDHSDNGTSVQEVSSRMTGFKLGGWYDMGSGSSIDGAVLLRFNKASYTNSATGANPSALEMSGGLEFGADVKWIHKINEKWNVVPIGRFSTFNWGPQETPAPASPSANPFYNFTHTEYEVGVGTQYHTDKVLIVGGFSVQSISSVTEDKRTATVAKTTESEMDLPKINMGVEFSITDWMVARAGYFKRLSSSESKFEGTTTSDFKTSEELPYPNDPNYLSAGQQAFTLGAGFHFSGFSLDGTIGEGYLINGPWPLSGIAQSVFGMVSTHYSW
jgi:hypothetical protein